MDDFSEDKLDDQLRDHFAQQLGPHMGSARAMFEKRVIAPAMNSTPRRTRQWNWAIPSLTALAAGVAIAVFINPFAPRSSEPFKPSGTVVSQGSIIPMPSQVVGEIPSAARAVPVSMDKSTTTWWATYDDGIIERPNYTPARRLRRVQFEKRIWVDDGGIVKESITTPQQDVIFIDLKSN
jgi:hypothetical protein